MNCCASPTGLNEVFDERMARADARRYLRRGLAARARRLLAAIRSEFSVEGHTACEVGAGAGGLSIELVRNGLDRGTLVDASAAYVITARMLAQRMHVDDRVEIIYGDYAEQRDLPDADLVVMDRVVCCYADWQALLDHAARQARRGIALSYPRDSWWTALLVRIVNTALRLTRRAFRMQHHSPAVMQQFLRDHGFRPRVAGHYWMWEITVAGRG